MRKIIILVLLVGIFLAVGSITAQNNCAAGEWHINGECVSTVTLEAGWNTVLPGGETRCAHDTAFQFWVYPGSEHVLLFFQGGGGCWDSETCREGSSWYKQAARQNEAQGYLGRGIFDLDNPDNPFADHTMIFVPSCTGDVYMGNAVTDYGDDVVIYHRGFVNLMAAVSFMGDAFPNPDSIFVTGCSAGSPGSAIAAPQLIEIFPQVPVVQLGDSLGAIFDTFSNVDGIWGVSDSLPEWIPDVPSADAFLMSDYYTALANHYPDYTFAQYNYQFDRIQQRYFSIGEDDPAAFLAASLDKSLTTISEDADNFRYFLADGDRHCIMPTPQFYTVQSDGVSFRDWVADLAVGQAVETVRCVACDN